MQDQLNNPPAIVSNSGNAVHLNHIWPSTNWRLWSGIFSTKSGKRSNVKQTLFLSPNRRLWALLSCI